MTYHKLSNDEMMQIDALAKDLQDADKAEIFEELVSMYKQGRIEGLESAFEKLDTDFSKSDDE